MNYFDILKEETIAQAKEHANAYDVSTEGASRMSSKLCKNITAALPQEVKKYLICRDIYCQRRNIIF